MCTGLAVPSVCILTVPSLIAHGRRVWLGRRSFAQGPPDRVPLHWFDLWPLSCRWGWGVSVPQGCSFSLLESRHGGCMECEGRGVRDVWMPKHSCRRACVAHEHNTYTVQCMCSTLSWPEEFYPDLQITSSEWLRFSLIWQTNYIYCVHVEGIVQYMYLCAIIHLPVDNM